MLRFIRRYRGSTFEKVLFGLLAALFVIWGVGSFGGTRVDVVAQVHDQPITRRELDHSAALLQRRYEEMMKGQFSPEMARSLNLRGQALDQLIDAALLGHEAKRLGIAVTEAELIDAITQLPELREDGKFNRARLEAALRYQRDRGEFEAEMRRSLLFQRMQALLTDGVQVSDAEVEERYRLDHEQVDLAFVRIPAAELAKTATVTDEDLQRVLAEHADRYREPTRVQVRYVAYPTAEFAPRVEVQESEIADYYDQHTADRFTRPEQVRARHILVQPAPGADDAAKAAARKKAEGLLTKVRGKADFAEVATKSSDDPGSASKGGDLGFFGRNSMTPAFEEVAFALEPGQISEVVDTPFGFHIIKVEERRQAGVQSLDEVRDQIVDTLRTERGIELARKQAEDDRGAVVRGKTLVEAVGSRPLTETPPFAAGGDVPGLGQVPGFAETAFALATGEVSDLIETEQTVYLLAPFARTEAHAPALDDVRARVEADVRRQRGQTLAGERTDTLLARAKEIGLDKAAAEAGGTVDTTGPFERRGGAIPKIGMAPDLRTDAFTLTAEAPLAPKVYTAGGDGIVAALKSHTAADMSGLAAARDALRDSMLQQKRAAAVTAYMSYLKEQAQRGGALDVRADALSRG